MDNRIVGTTLAIAVLAIGGCTTYYKVTDPSTQKTYYTTSVRELKGGAVEFKDAVSGAKVTVQNSEIAEVNRETYKAATPKK